MVGFCGSGGSPLFSSLDLTFLAPQSEYRPTEYMQIWMKAWLDDNARLLMAKILLLERIVLVSQSWKKNLDLIQHGIYIDDNALNTFKQDIDRSENQQELLAAEGRWAKALYKELAKGFNIDFKRDEGKTHTILLPISRITT